MLTCDYFNPVVADWTPACQEEEIRQRETCDAILYTLTGETPGFYSIAEAVDDSNKRPSKTVFCLLPDTFEAGHLKHMRKVADMVANNGGYVVEGLKDAAIILNQWENT